MNRHCEEFHSPGSGLGWACGVLRRNCRCPGGRLRLCYGDGAADRAAPDGQIEMDVVHALDASNALKGDLITAATIQGEVTLSGTVVGEASSELRSRSRPRGGRD